MHKLFRIWLTVSAMALAVPTAAQAQTASKFDGTYGVSPATGSGQGKCSQMETPTPLSIAKGSAQSADGNFTGSVDSSGRLILRTKDALRFDGQIDDAGVARVLGASKQGCLYTLSWKRR